MLRCTLKWASRFDVERWLLLASRLDLNAGLNQSCVWSLSYTFDDLSPMIFRQSTEPLLKFLKLRSWLERVSEHFGLFFWQWLSRLNWQSSEIPWAWSCLDPSLRECTIKLFKATRDDHHECLDTQLDLISALSWLLGTVEPRKIVNCFCQYTVELIAEVETEHRHKGHIVLETRTSSEVETRLSFAVEMQLSRT